MLSNPSESGAVPIRSNGKVRVLVVDDSAVVRKLMTEILLKDRQIEVVGVAMDAYAARDKIKKLRPDVITLDVEMPKMDGVTFLRNLMRLNPLPVIMVSTLTEKGADVTLDALDAGAVDFVSKPKLDITNTLEEYAEEIRSKVKSAATVRVKRLESRAVKPAPTSGLVSAKHSIDEVIPSSPGRRNFRTTDKIIAIGASTGGTEAIREVLQTLPVSTPGIVIAQHIPETFSKAFAERLNQRCALKVSEARDGDIIVPGYAYVAPGNRHLLVEKDGAKWRCRLSDALPVNRHKPSVDVLFRSVANAAGQNAIGVILTGMGKDGAQGLKDMRNEGARTIAQDEASSVVWGMPGSAVELDAAEQIVPLSTVGKHMLSVLQEG